MNLIKRPRRYAFLAKDKISGEYFGMCLDYQTWKLEPLSVTVFSAQRFTITETHRTRLTQAQETEQRISKLHNDTLKRAETRLYALHKKIENRYELVKVRIGSKKCPVRIDWRFIDRKTKDGQIIVPFSLRS